MYYMFFYYCQCKKQGKITDHTSTITKQTLIIIDIAMADDY